MAQTDRFAGQVDGRSRLRRRPGQDPARRLPGPGPPGPLRRLLRLLPLRCGAQGQRQRRPAGVHQTRRPGHGAVHSRNDAIDIPDRIQAAHDQTAGRAQPGGRRPGRDPDRGRPGGRGLLLRQAAVHQAAPPTTPPTSPRPVGSRPGSDVRVSGLSRRQGLRHPPGGDEGPGGLHRRRRASNWATGPRRRSRPRPCWAPRCSS